MDQPDEQINISQTEKLLGLFSHLSVFFGRLLIPFIIWAVNRKKSKFVAFHSLQALFFHLSLTFVNVFVSMLGGLILGVYSGLTKHKLNDLSNLTIFQIIILALIVIFVLINVIFGFVLGTMNALSAYEGETKKYPLIGSIIHKKIYGI